MARWIVIDDPEGPSDAFNVDAIEQITFEETGSGLRALIHRSAGPAYPITGAPAVALRKVVTDTTALNVGQFSQSSQTSSGA